MPGPRFSRYLATGESGAVASSNSSALWPTRMTRARTRCDSIVFRSLDLQTERVAIERERLIEVLYHDSDVVEDGFHSDRGSVFGERGSGAISAWFSSSAAAV